VEAEEASFAHDSSKKFAEVIENRVENEGFNVIFKTVPQPENKNDNVIVWWKWDMSQVVSGLTIVDFTYISGVVLKVESFEEGIIEGGR